MRSARYFPVDESYMETSKVSIEARTHRLHQSSKSKKTKEATTYNTTAPSGNTRKERKKKKEKKKKKKKKKVKKKGKKRKGAQDQQHMLGFLLQPSSKRLSSFKLMPYLYSRLASLVLSEVMLL